MPPGNVDIWTSVWGPLLGDPVLLVGLFLPFVFIGILFYSRFRLSRRLTAMSARNARALDETSARWKESSARNARALDENAARWDESVARTEKMIALLTEIRDHMAALTAPADAPRHD
jgi:hypothetical protein